MGSREREREERRTLVHNYRGVRRCPEHRGSNDGLQCELDQGHEGHCAALDEELGRVVVWPGPKPIEV